MWWLGIALRRSELFVFIERYDFTVELSVDTEKKRRGVRGLTLFVTTDKPRPPKIPFPYHEMFFITVTKLFHFY